MDTHDPRDLALGRTAIESGVIERSDASRILAVATAQRCGFIEAARQLGVAQAVLERLARLQAPSSSGVVRSGTGSSARPPSSTVAPNRSGSQRVTAASGRLALAKRLEPGATFGGHVIERTLGQGGMGVVLLARDPSGALHALKVPFFDANAEDRRKRFVREAQALAKLSHPGILKVHSVGEDDNQPYCVLELVDGDALDALIAKGPLDPDRALAIGEAMARALAHAHDQGVVHRDVKPSNIMVRKETGQAILMDFGLARDEQAESLTKTGAMLGTPRYMAPEQAAGSRVDGRADIYSLGATVYELLVGEPVFEADSTIALVAKIATEPAEPPSKKRPGLSASVDAVILRSLEKLADDRYQTALEFAEDLARARRGETVGERPRLRARRRKLAALFLVLLVGGSAGAFYVAKEKIRRSKEAARETKRQEARDAVLAAGEAWRAARFGLDPGKPDAFEAAVKAFEEASGPARGASDALAASVERARAVVAVERALVAGDRSAARAALEKVTDGPDSRLLAALVLDDPKAAHDALEAVARESGDARIRMEAALALVRLETATEPQAALRRLGALPPPGEDDTRAGEKELRKRVLVAVAEAQARDGNDPIETIVAVERLDAAVAKEAARRAARAGTTRVGKEAPRPLTARLWKLYGRDTSAFAQPELVAPLLQLAVETFKTDDVALASCAFEMASRGDPTVAVPGAIVQGLPSASQALLVKGTRDLEELLDIEVMFVRIGEHSAVLEAFEQASVILAGLEKRLERRPREWPTRLAIAARVKDHERGLKLVAEALAQPEVTARARNLCHVLRAEHLKALKRDDEALKEAELAIREGYGKPDALGLEMGEMLLDMERYSEALEWGQRATVAADDRVARSEEGYEALAAGRPAGYPLQPVGAIARAIRTKPRVVVLEALLALRRFDEARTTFLSARECGADKEASHIHESLRVWAGKLDSRGKSDAAELAREMSEKAKEF